MGLSTKCLACCRFYVGCRNTISFTTGESSEERPGKYTLWIMYRLSLA